MYLVLELAVATLRNDPHLGSKVVFRHPVVAQMFDSFLAVKFHNLPKENQREIYMCICVYPPTHTSNIYI